MKLSDSQIIQAPREAVWRALNDPQVLKACIPGCQSIQQTSPTEMNAVVVAKVGPVSASFKGAVKLSEINAPESYRISGTGEGGLAGFATGGATVKLTELGPNETQMDYDVDAQIGGKLAMLGSRLIDGTARSLAEQFFTKFAAMAKSSAKSATKVAAAPVAVAPSASRVVGTQTASPSGSRLLEPVRAGSVPVSSRIVSVTASTKPSVTATTSSATTGRASTKKAAKKAVKKSAKPASKKAAKPTKKVVKKAAKKKTKR